MLARCSSLHIQISDFSWALFRHVSTAIGTERSLSLYLSRALYLSMRTPKIHFIARCSLRDTKLSLDSLWSLYQHFNGNFINLCIAIVRLHIQKWLISFFGLPIVWFSVWKQTIFGIYSRRNFERGEINLNKKNNETTHKNGTRIALVALRVCMYNAPNRISNKRKNFLFYRLSNSTMDGTIYKINGVLAQGQTHFPCSMLNLPHTHREEVTAAAAAAKKATTKAPAQFLFFFFFFFTNKVHWLWYTLTL